MEDMFGELIYIIIMVVILIFSALRKKKGGGEDMPEYEEEQGRPNPMDEVFSPFKDIFNDEEREENPANESSSSQERTTSTAADSRGTLEGAPFVKDDYVFTAKTSPGDKRRQRINKSPGQQTTLKSEENQPYGYEQGKSEVAEWFDLRQAVIFSEILKRPDY